MIRAPARLLTAFAVLNLVIGTQADPPSTVISADPVFSNTRGIFKAPFQLRLSCPTPGAKIRYTVDGSGPSSSHGIDYAAPIPVGTTTCVRVATFTPDGVSSPVRTQTYLFPAAVRNQPALPPSYPTVWRTKGGGEAVADYEVDPRVTSDANYNATFENDLLALPTLSMVLDKADLFDPARGIYANPLEHGKLWERAASIEWIDPNGRAGFQQDCGVRIKGESTRGLDYRKHSFRLHFKKEYGSGKLKFPIFADSPVKEFDTLDLRAGGRRAWVGTDANETTYLEDEWHRRMQIAMGQMSPRGVFVHLYLNGLYWGLYNLTEYPDASFATAYLGGNKKEWDVLSSNKGLQAVDGELTAWKALVALCSTSFTDRNGWNQILGYLDMDNFIDYMMLNFYSGASDWDTANFAMARRRVEGGTFKFFAWDSEMSLDDVGADRTGLKNAGKPSGIYNAMRGPVEGPCNAAHVEFRFRFADRVQKHLFNQGALTPVAAANLWNSLEAQIDRAIVGESARWGDARSGGQHPQPYTRDGLQNWKPTIAAGDFLNENQKRMTLFNPPNPASSRTAKFLAILRRAKLYPPEALVAPSLNQNGGKIAPGFQLTMSSTTDGTIYYTLDGTDPREVWTAVISGDGNCASWSGKVATRAIAYGGGFALKAGSVVQARVRERSTGLWSALSEARFHIEENGR